LRTGVFPVHLILPRKSGKFSKKGLKNGFFGHFWQKESGTAGFHLFGSAGRGKYDQIKI
jgi:hypothetical protein